MDKPGTVSIDLDSDPDVSYGLDGFTEGEGSDDDVASDETMAWALDLAEKNHAVLH